MHLHETLLVNFPRTHQAFLALFTAIDRRSRRNMVDHVTAICNLTGYCSDEIPSMLLLLLLLLLLLYYYYYYYYYSIY